MLLFLGMEGVPVVAIGIGFGVVFAVAIAALWIWKNMQRRRLA